MPKRSKAELDILITAAARLFATQTRDPKEILELDKALLKEKRAVRQHRP